ncbi:MAG: aminoacyl-histidine dipeptidase [Gemmatimonadota bacterium]
MTFVAELEPRSLWAHFDEILTIPRGSKKEERARAYVVGVAERNGLRVQVDDVGNVVVSKPATEGLEKAPVVVLQAHLDMVNEKNADVEHDFDRDPIRPVREGEWLTADGTTLGADNGIGMAAMLALMESGDVRHGPLEFLFTIDEETGLTGAARLAPGLLEGRILLNLDSEEDGVLTIGCAGGGDTHIHLPLDTEPVAPAAVALEVAISGLRGGHSGCEIHLQRGNSIRALSRALRAALDERAFAVLQLSGGNAHNAIPREATAGLVASAPEEAEAIGDRIRRELELVRRELHTSDPGLGFTIQAAPAPKTAWTAGATQRALDLLVALPHGVLRMSDDMDGLVETSTNLAVVRTEADGLRILMSSRSSVESALAALRMRLRSLASLAGAEVDEKDGYPPWRPNVDSPLLEVVRSLHRERIGEPEVGAVHAGLEASIIAEKYEGMDMISFGPQIEFPHSPDERVRIESVGTFYDFLGALLGRLASEGP